MTQPRRKMQSPPLEAGSHTAIQQIPCLLWNQKFHYYNNSPQMELILSQINPVHILTPYYFMIF